MQKSSANPVWCSDFPGSAILVTAYANPFSSSNLLYNEDSKTITIIFDGLKGEYEIVLLEGFALDNAGNPSGEVKSSKFTVSDKKDTIIHRSYSRDNFLKKAEA